MTRSMAKLDKSKEQSSLVQAVLTLDDYFSELTRLSGRIGEMELKSDSDFEQFQRLMNLFAESGEGITEMVVSLSTALNEARSKAEAAAKIVGERAEEFQAEKAARQKKMDEFRILGEKVNAVTSSLNDLKRPEGVEATEEDRAKISARLTEVVAQLQPLIEEAQNLKNEARDSRMKSLEQNAHSLSQSLLSIGQKLSGFQQSQANLPSSNQQNLH
jgi:hypothetical protein